MKHDEHSIAAQENAMGLGPESIAHLDLGNRLRTLVKTAMTITAIKPLRWNLLCQIDPFVFMAFPYAVFTGQYQYIFKVTYRRKRHPHRQLQIQDSFEALPWSFPAPDLIELRLTE